MKTGDRIRILREDRKITQEELARAVGYKTRSSIAKIETGESDPPQKMLKKIADVLGVIPAELLDDSNKGTSAAVTPQTEEAKYISFCTDKMPLEERQRFVQMAKLMFSKYFEEGNEQK